MAKSLDELQWIEELLPESFNRRAMFGGFAYYDGPFLKLIMFENGSDKWNGCMFPAEKEHHEKLLNQFSFLVNHSVLPKWLFLSLNDENFEEHAKKVVRDLSRPQSLWGTIPDKKKKAEQKATGKTKSQGKDKASLKNKKEKVLKVEPVSAQDMRKPRMFRDESLADSLHKIKTIQDFKNFGPSTEKIFIQANIKTPALFMKMGWKKSFAKICEVNPKYNHSLFAYALIGALENKEWNAISEDLKTEAQTFAKKLRDKAKALKEKNKAKAKKKPAVKVKKKLKPTPKSRK